MSYPKVPVMRANAPESERNEANLLKAEIRSEFLEAKKMTKSKGKMIMKQEFKKGKESHLNPVMSRADYRAHILAHSLFPNVFNKEMVMTNLGAS
jgi:hypothetical protein